MTKRDDPFGTLKEFVMLVKNPKFEISAVRPNQYPSNGLPEIVLVRKIQCGKIKFCKYND